MTEFKTKPHPMANVPRDGRLLRLLVKDGSNPVEDDDTFWTIGLNNFLNDGIDEWELVGWDWEQDCFTDTSGKVIGWLPFMPEEE